MHRGHIDARVAIQDKLAVGRPLHGMVTISLGQFDEFGAIDSDAAKMLMIGVLSVANRRRRRNMLISDLFDAFYVPFAACYGIDHVAGIHIDSIQMIPTASFAAPNGGRIIKPA